MRRGNINGLVMDENNKISIEEKGIFIMNMMAQWSHIRRSGLDMINKLE